MRKWTVLAEDGEITIELEPDGSGTLSVFPYGYAVSQGVELTAEQMTKFMDAVGDATDFARDGL